MEVSGLRAQVWRDIFISDMFTGVHNSSERGSSSDTLFRPVLSHHRTVAKSKPKLLSENLFVSYLLVTELKLHEFLYSFVFQLLIFFKTAILILIFVSPLSFTIRSRTVINLLMHSM
jgi:hypothetical protein